MLDILYMNLSLGITRYSTTVLRIVTMGAFFDARLSPPILNQPFGSWQQPTNTQLIHLSRSLARRPATSESLTGEARGFIHAAYGHVKGPAIMFLRATKYVSFRDVTMV